VQASSRVWLDLVAMASFVPTRHDFSRLDPRFNLPDEVWQALPGYYDWGFAVFKLRPMSRRTDIHPMAFEFPQRNPDRLFFPTVHVHNGRVEPRATFDHVLYCQDVDELRRERWHESFQSRSPWEQSSVALDGVFDADRAEGIIRPDRPCHRVPITGFLREHRCRDLNCGPRREGDAPKVIGESTRGKTWPPKIVGDKKCSSS
jgi:hypothetical protein